LAVFAVALIGPEVNCAGSAFAGSQNPAAGSATVTIEGNHPVADLREFEPADPNRALELEIVFAPRDKPALERLLKEQQDPASPNYHRWLGPDEFAARFGPASADFEAVEDWLKSAGFTIAGAGAGNRLVKTHATVAQVQQAFGVAIVASRDGRLFANRSDPRIPARFAGIIAHIDGMDNLRRFVPAGP
jgi:subtilase family serine protease